MRIRRILGLALAAATLAGTSAVGIVSASAASSPTITSDECTDPHCLQQGVQCRVGFLVRMGEPDVRVAERVGVVLADREAETLQPEQNDVETVQPVP
ncbi:hypothetical protein [Streptomyces xanthophaeus]|uniref:hypothetical protein n=1 Tax=Streptomyces xanthophaeus TaxID=67385 RepID=UPI0004CCD436|nr:hypothetical protein [Streptomyces xanthophaeus]